MGDRRYRAAELADAVGISVQLLRSYQSKGLLPPPRHEGRVAWYGDHHRARLLRILDLKGRGYSLRAIGEVLDGDTRPLDDPAAVVDEHESLRLTDVADRSGVPVEMLRALEASRLLVPQPLAGGDRYSDADVRFVRHVLTLLGVGLSLDDLMRIARHQLDVTGELGREVVAAWSHLVGERLRRPDRDDAERAERVATSLRSLAAIVGQLVAYRVERAVLDAAAAHLADSGAPDEREAFTRVLATPHGDQTQR